MKNWMSSFRGYKECQCNGQTHLAHVYKEKQWKSSPA